MVLHSDTNTFTLLLDDEIIVNENYIKASELKVGDNIVTSEGIKRIKNKNISTVYCTIELE